MHSKFIEQETDLGLTQSSLVLRFVNNDFQENKEPTIGGKLQELNTLLVVVLR